MADSLKINTVTARQIPAISFSLREVLIHSNPPLNVWLRDFLKLHENLSEQDFEKLWWSWRSQRNSLAAAGEFSGDDRNESLKKFVSENFPTSAQKFDEVYRASIKLVFPQYVEDVLVTLKERGYRLACVTNEPEASLEYLKMFRLLDFFETLILAKEEGHPKPESRAFELLIEELQIQPNQLIHVGSQFATDVCAARAANVASLIYDPLKEELKTIELLEATPEKKVISISEVRQNRWSENLRVIHKFDELLEIFR